jgi:hypothetical protein
LVYGFRRKIVHKKPENSVIPRDHRKDFFNGTGLFWETPDILNGLIGVDNRVNYYPRRPNRTWHFLLKKDSGKTVSLLYQVRVMRTRLSNLRFFAVKLSLAVAG